MSLAVVVNKRTRQKPNARSNRRAFAAVPSIVVSDNAARNRANRRACKRFWAE